MNPLKKTRISYNALVLLSFILVALLFVGSEIYTGLTVQKVLPLLVARLRPLVLLLSISPC